MRKTFTTTIEEDVQKVFKAACVQHNAKMNDVLEAFMKSYSNGEFIVQTEIKLKKVTK